MRLTATGHCYELHRGIQDLGKNNPSPEKNYGSWVSPVALQPVAEYGVIRVETSVLGKQTKPLIYSSQPS